MRIIAIPPEIDILGVTYEVDYVKEMEHGGQVAQIHYLEGTISIQKDMSPEIQFISFIHEVNHGILQGLNHFMRDMIYHDENFVETTAQAWGHVIKQIVDYNKAVEIVPEEEAEEDEEMPEKDILNIDIEGLRRLKDGTIF